MGTSELYVPTGRAALTEIPALFCDLVEHHACAFDGTMALLKHNCYENRVRQIIPSSAELFGGNGTDGVIHAKGMQECSLTSKSEYNMTSSNSSGRFLT
jgi:hypothetical protein